MPDLKEFPDLFKAYRWPGRHDRFGYPADAGPRFEWMSSLERRFQWVRNNIHSDIDTPIYLIRELLHWGDGAHGVAQRLELSIGDVCVNDLLKNLISCIADNDSVKALETAKRFPGYGDVYATKLLRFLDPQNYGALDARIRNPKENYSPPVDLSGNWDTAYETYLEYIRQKRDELNENKEKCGLSPEIELFSFKETREWCAAHVEMALFAFATREGGYDKRT